MDNIDIDKVFKQKHLESLKFKEIFKDLKPYINNSKNVFKSNIISIKKIITTLKIITNYSNMPEDFLNGKWFIEFGEAQGKDPILYAYDKNILIEGTNSIIWAIQKNVKINDIDAALWAKDHNIPTDNISELAISEPSRSYSNLLPQIELPNSKSNTFKYIAYTSLGVLAISIISTCIYYYGPTLNRSIAKFLHNLRGDSINPTEFSIV